METFKKILKNEKIPFRNINTPGVSETIQILKCFKTNWLKTVIKNQGLKIIDIDNTCLIFNK